MEQNAPEAGQVQKGIYGDCNVPSEWSEDPLLGSWAVKKRYRRNKWLLKEERIRTLGEVGMR